MRRSVRTILGAAAIALLVPGTGQAVGTPVIVTGPGATYAPVFFPQPVFVASAGDEVIYVNADPTGRHDVTAIEYGSDEPSYCSELVGIGQNATRRFPEGRCPMFWTPLISVSQQTPILGLEQIVAGESYEFFCSIHGNMKGTLIAV